MSILAEAFLKNRAEQLPADVSDQFIVPPFFGRISIFADTKSVRILGGRGCGKTMFIRHFCHSTTFSPRKRNIDDEVLKSVGLYLRPDTGFCSLMTPAWLGEEEARLAFSHYVALQLLAEAHQAVENIARADLAAGPLDVRDLKLSSALSLQFSREVSAVGQLGAFVEEKLAELELWVRNPKRCPAPIFLSFASVLPRLAEDMAKKLPRLADLSFRAFIDEFENLGEHQRMIVCDAIKHPSLRLTVERIEIKTSPENFNFIFSHPANPKIYRTLYATLPTVLLYLTMVVMTLYQRIPAMDAGSKAALLFRAINGYRLYLGGQYAKAVEDGLSDVLTPRVKCPDCRTRMKVTRSNAAKLVLADCFQCTACRRKQLFPLSWMF